MVGSRDIGAHVELATGAAAGGLAGIITTPLDVIKTRIQTQLRTEATPLSISRTPSFFSSQTSCLQKSSSRNLHTAQSSKIVSKLESENTYQVLKSIYTHEGINGLFSGVGPRFIWMSVQSSIMLFAYQRILRALEDQNPVH